MPSCCSWYTREQGLGLNNDESQNQIARNQNYNQNNKRNNVDIGLDVPQRDHMDAAEYPNADIFHNGPLMLLKLL